MRACQFPDDVAVLEQRLRQSGQESRLNAVRDWLLKAGDQLVEASYPLPALPWPPSPPTTTGSEAAGPASHPGAGAAVSPRAEAGPTKRSFGWLHLTDLHFGMSGQRWLWPNVKEEFFRDLTHLHEKVGPWELVFFTGDFVQRGGADEFVGLDRLLAGLWEHLRGLGSDPVLLAVPGNHDLVRPDPARAAVAALRTGWDDQHVQEKFWGKGNSEYRKVIGRAFKNYSTWWEGHKLPRPGDYQAGPLPGDFSATLEKGGWRLGLVGLNTTFLQLEGGDYKGRLAVSAQQFHEACGGDGAAWTATHHASILLTHQPPDWLTDQSREELYGEIAKPGRFAVHLFGHMHESASRNSSRGGSDPRREWQGCSLFGLAEWGEEKGKGQRLHGYSAGRVDLEGNRGFIRQWPRVAVRHQAEHLHIVRDTSFTLEGDGGTRPEPVVVTAST